MPLVLFPETTYDKDRYLLALGAVLHEPVSAALVPVMWHGTVGYQPFIKASGFDNQQALLGRVWSEICACHERLRILGDAATQIAGAKAVPEVSGIADQAYKHAQSLIRAAGERLELLRTADSRLRTALLYHLETTALEDRHIPGAAPVFNVTLAPQISMPEQKVEVSVELPDRVTTTEVERDAAGDIVRTVQIETNAP